MKRAATDCAVLPLTRVIVPPIERQFLRVLRRTPSHDARVLLGNMLAGASRAQQRIEAGEILTRSTRRSKDALGRAVRRMTDVDLDTAWRAALRGDERVLDARVHPHVTRPPKRGRSGSPWRTSRWLSRAR
jgi:hypothetical protein